MDGFHQLPVDVELELQGRCVTYPDRERGLVPGKPIELELREPALPRHPVQDLDLRWVASCRSDHPPQPCLGFIPAASLDETVESECGVPDPAVAVVPVPGAAEGFGQGGGWGGNDTPRRRIGERLQCHKRPLDHVLPFAVHFVQPAQPVVPVGQGLGQSCLAVQVPPGVLVGGRPPQPETEPVPFLDREARCVAHVRALQLDRAVQLDRVRARHCPDTVLGLDHPRDLGTVLEPDQNLCEPSPRFPGGPPLSGTPWGGGGAAA